ncbi:MAG: nucleotidyltransferase family protein, partial [Anaerolineae bacterium]|nr:nucleotidyltransferase family protein [Anaerolineae bacterium]
MGIQHDLRAACWPTTIQEQLLQAVLLSGTKGLTAWENWLKNVSFFEDPLQGGTYQLLPLLYRNLRRLGVDDAFSGRLRGIVRNTWTRNQLHIQQLIPVFTALCDAGIPLLLLGKTALYFATYADDSTILLGESDFAVSEADLNKAHVLILNTGLWSEIEDRDIKQPGNRHRSSWRYKNRYDYILHVRCHMPMRMYEDNTIFTRAVPVVIQDMAVRALNPTEQLVVLCLDGLFISRMLTIEWIAHIVNILNSSKTDIDWAYLIDFIQQHKLVFAFRTILHYTAQKLGASIPKRYLDTLADLPVRGFEKREWHAIVNARSGPGSRVQRLRRLWYGYARVQALNASQ